jgi:CubicO group peptidase (beta-lactamase class C family)
MDHRRQRKGDQQMAEVNGWVAPGFERVRATIEAMPAPWARGGGGLAAYVRGKLVVDLWGGQARPGLSWREDSIACVASVTKSWAAVVVERLVEQGLLDHSSPISTWWPEFAANGKERVTLHDLFTHSSGVLSFDGACAFLDADDCNGWKDLDGIAERLAASTPSWTPGTRNGYHAVSYGWLLNELVRRVSGSTIGELFDRDVCKPLGLDLHLGTSLADQQRVAFAMSADPTKRPWLMRKLLAHGRSKGSDPQTLFGRALLGDGKTTILDRAPAYIQVPAWLESEVPGSNGTATARSLARLFAALASGGELDGVRILEPATVAVMRQPRGEVADAVMGELIPALLKPLLPKAALTYGLTPNRKFRGKLQLGPNPASFASMGFGGQLVMGDPDAQLSFASILTDFTQGVDAALQRPALNALYACL